MTLLPVEIQEASAAQDVVHQVSFVQWLTPPAGYRPVSSRSSLVAGICHLIALIAFTTRSNTRKESV